MKPPPLAFTISISLISIIISILSLNEIREIRKTQQSRIQYLESVVNKKPLVILPQPKRFRIKFSNEDDTFYVYPVLDSKWEKPISRHSSTKSGLPL